MVCSLDQNHRGFTWMTWGWCQERFPRPCCEEGFFLHRCFLMTLCWFRLICGFKSAEAQAFFLMEIILLHFIPYHVTRKLQWQLTNYYIFHNTDIIIGNEYTACIIILLSFVSFWSIIDAEEFKQFGFSCITRTHQ